MASSISLPSFAAKTSNILNPDGTSIDQSFAPTNGGMFRNGFINGNFDIWQRATSQSVSGYGSADRWQLALTGSTAVMSRQTHTLGQTDVPNNPTYFLRAVVTSVANANNLALFRQNIENVSRFAGQTVTISFYAKADAAKPISVEATQSFGTGGSPSAAVTGVGVKTTLSTAWARYTVQLAIPSIAGKTIGTNGDDYLQINFWLDAGSSFNTRTNTLGQQSGTFDISQIQIEQGSSATPFEVRPIGTELALCQRYLLASGGGASESPAIGSSYSTTGAQVIIYHPVAMRSKTRNLTLSNVSHFNMGIPAVVATVTTGITYSSADSSDFTSFLNLGYSNGSAGGGKVCYLQANTTAARLFIDAEL